MLYVIPGLSLLRYIKMSAVKRPGDMLFIFLLQLSNLNHYHLLVLHLKAPPHPLIYHMTLMSNKSNATLTTRCHFVSLLTDI